MLFDSFAYNMILYVGIPMWAFVCFMVHEHYNRWRRGHRPTRRPRSWAN